MKKTKYLSAAFLLAATFVPILSVTESLSDFKPKYTASITIPLDGTDKPLTDLPAASDSNLLLNPSFEEGKRDWNFLEPGEVVDGSAHALAGNKCLKITVDPRLGDARGWFRIAQDIKGVRPGEKFTFSCWMKTNDLQGTGQATVVIKFWIDPNTDKKADQFKAYLIPTEARKGTTDWCEYSSTVVAPDNFNGRLQIVCFVSYCSSGEVYFDDLRFGRGEGQGSYVKLATAAAGPAVGQSAETNLVKNPGFEDPQLAPWNKMGPQGEVVTENPRSGKKCYKIEVQPTGGSTHGWFYNWQSIKGNWQGKSFKFSGWMRLENTTGLSSLGIKFYETLRGVGGAEEFYPLSWEKGTKDWTYYEGIYTAQDSTREILIYLLCQPGTGVAYCDDFHLELLEVPDPPAPID